MPAVSVRTLLRDASAVFESMERDRAPILITRRGRPVAALVPVDPEQADAMILSAAPEMIESRRQAENARAEGRTTPLDDAMKRLDAMDAEQAVQKGDDATVDEEHREADITQTIGPRPEDLKVLTYLLGDHHATNVNRIAKQRANQITHDALAKATAAGLIERTDLGKQHEERITQLNARLIGLCLRQELTRDLLERVAAVSAGTTSLENIADPREGILGKSLTDAALGEASTFVSELNADVIAHSTRGSKLALEIMEAVLSVNISALEKGRIIEPLPTTKIT